MTAIPAFESSSAPTGRLKWMRLLREVLWGGFGVLLCFVTLLAVCEGRNRYCQQRLETGYRELWRRAEGDLPLFFTTLRHGESRDIGFYHWPVGPFEYRDRATGEMRWTE